MVKAYKIVRLLTLSSEVLSLINITPRVFRERTGIFFKGNLIVTAFLEISIKSSVFSLTTAVAAILPVLVERLDTLTPIPPRF